MAQNRTTHNNSNNSGTNSSNRGFAGMDSDRQRSIASLGGMSQGKENNPGNFANNPERAREAGKSGGMSRGKTERGMNTTDRTNPLNRTSNSQNKNNSTDEA